MKLELSRGMQSVAIRMSFPFCSGIDCVSGEVWANKSICITCNCSGMLQKLAIINFIADATDYS